MGKFSDASARTMTNATPTYRDDYVFVAPSKFLAKINVKGFGLCATKGFEPNDVIQEYRGIQISFKESKSRRSEYMFEVNSKNGRFVIDGADIKHASAARYVNSTLEPDDKRINAKFIQYSQKIYLVATRKIPAKAEIIAHYGKYTKEIIAIGNGGESHASSSSEDDNDAETKNRVLRLLGSRGSGSSKEYYVRWARLSSEHDSWEPEADILDKNMIAKFEKRQNVLKQHICSTLFFKDVDFFTNDIVYIMVNDITSKHVLTKYFKTFDKFIPFESLTTEHERDVWLEMELIQLKSLSQNGLLACLRPYKIFMYLPLSTELTSKYMSTMEDMCENIEIRNIELNESQCKNEFSEEELAFLKTYDRHPSNVPVTMSLWYQTYLSSTATL